MAKNLTAANKAIRALALGDEHAGLVELVRSLARAVDAAPDDANLFREYRQALKELGSLGSGDDDGAAEFLVSITTPGRGAVGNTSIA